MGTVFGLILLGICAIGLLIAGFAMFFLNVEIYFLKFKLEEHPKLLTIIENMVQNICIEESIKVFHKTFEELNIGTIDENKKAVGRYVYTIDQEYQQRINKSLDEIEELEVKYKMPYKQLCAFVGHETTIDKENFVLPRILLCDEELKKYGWKSYYDTFFHELGHHFAVKEIGTEHNEIDADKYAYILIKQSLPFYFRLIFDFQFRYRLDKTELAGKEKLIAYISYLKYLIIEKWHINLS